MKKFLFALVAFGLATTMAADAEAGPFRWFRRGRPVYVQPAQPTARADQTYRTFSYQPMTVAPELRYVAPAGGTTRSGHAYQNATNKAMGRVN
jgi:hypothetical protein